MTSVTCSKSWCPSEENGLFSARSAPHPPEFQRHYDKRENNFHLKRSTICLFVWRIKCFPLLQSQRCQSGAFPEKKAFQTEFLCHSSGNFFCTKGWEKNIPPSPQPTVKKGDYKRLSKANEKFCDHKTWNILKIVFCPELHESRLRYLLLKQRET